MANAAGGAGSKLKFRNYRPQDQSLKAERKDAPLPKPILDDVASSSGKRPDYEDPRASRASAAPGKKAKAAADDVIKREIKAQIEEQGGNELLNIAPKKPNWDLKRDVAKKVGPLLH